MADLSHVTSEIEKRMSDGSSFTYSQLSALAGGWGFDEGKHRLADKAIQRWRKKGWIAFTREGRLLIWNLTDEGRAEKARRKVCHG